MARKRQMPTDICQWPGFKNLTHEARLLYFLIYQFADDEGRMRDEPAHFARDLYPNESPRALRIESWLRELDHQGLIGRYIAEGFDWIVICAWSLQKIDHRSASKLPAPPVTWPLPLDEISIARAKRER